MNKFYGFFIEILNVVILFVNITWKRTKNCIIILVSKIEIYNRNRAYQIVKKMQVLHTLVYREFDEFRDPKSWIRQIHTIIDESCDI